MNAFLFLIIPHNQRPLAANFLPSDIGKTWVQCLEHSTHSVNVGHINRCSGREGTPEERMIMMLDYQLIWNLGHWRFVPSVHFSLQQVKGNFARLQACISELYMLQREDCFRPQGTSLQLAVEDGLQQFKQYSRHMTTGTVLSYASLEVRDADLGRVSHLPIAVHLDASLFIILILFSVSYTLNINFKARFSAPCRQETCSLFPITCAILSTQLSIERSAKNVD